MAQNDTTNASDALFVHNNGSDGIHDPDFSTAETGNQVLNYNDRYTIIILNAVRIKSLVVFMSVFFVVSLITNTLALIVLCHRAFLINSYAFGQRFLCVMDIAFALVVILGYLIQGVTETDVSDWNTDVCRAFRTTTFILSATSNWTLVYLATIRYMGIKYPFKIHSNLYLRASYASLVAMSFANSLFYATFYLSFDRLVDMRNMHLKVAGYCQTYSNNTMDIYMIHLILMLPDTILPGMCIVVLNTNIFISFGDLTRQANLMKHKLNVRTVRISKLRKSLCSQKYLLVADSIGRSSDSLSITSTMSTSKILSAAWKKLSLKHASSTPAISVVSDKLTNTIPSNTLRRSRRKHIVKKLLRERQKLRRATVTYSLLCEDFLLDKTRVKNSTFVKTNPENGDNNINMDYEVNNLCYLCRPCPTFASPFARKLLIISTLLFITLNAPYCIWFIFSKAIFTRSPIDVASDKLTSAIAAILKCGFHASNCVMYMLSSNKVRSEVDLLLKKLQGRR